MGNNESCFGMRHSILNFYGFPSFIGNKALDGSAIRVHTESQVSVTSMYHVLVCCVEYLVSV